MTSPSEAPGLGTLVHVVPEDLDHIYVGRLREHDGDTLVLEMREPYSLKSGGHVLLACTGPGTRVAAEAIVHDPYAPAGTSFVTCHEWWLIDTRSSERHAARLRARVRSPHSTVELLGVTIDISLGGAAIEVPEVPEDDELEVYLGLGLVPHYLPCEVVDAAPGAGSVMLRIRFQELTPRQHQHLSELVESLKTRPNPAV